jgi:hypothetical protein
VGKGMTPTEARLGLKISFEWWARAKKCHTKIWAEIFLVLKRIILVILHFIMQCICEFSSMRCLLAKKFLCYHFTRLGLFWSK